MVTSCDVHWEHFSVRNIKTFPEADRAAETRQSAQEDAVEGKWLQIAPSIQMAAGPFLLAR